MGSISVCERRDLELMKKIIMTLLFAAAVIMPVYAHAAGEPNSAGASWNYAAFKKAFAESGRETKLTEGEFNAVQERRKTALKTIEGYLASKFGSADPAVMKAFSEVPREYFHYHYANKKDFVAAAYEDKAKPWPIGFGSALSDYLGQAYMTQIAKPGPDDVVLEIGTGSGFQISVLSRIVKKAYSIEIVEPLGKAVGRIFAPLGYTNIETKVGDGFFGWPEVKGGFDIIIVTCSAQYVPQPLFDQLKPGGRLIIPIGTPFKRGHILYVYTKDKDGRIRSKKDIGVYFVPMTGEMSKKKAGQ